MRLARILAIIRRLLAQFRRDRRTLALLFVAPIVILSLLGYVMRGGGTRPAVGIVNSDTGTVGQGLVGELLGSTLVNAREMSADDADRQLLEGRLAGYVVLPADFSQGMRPGGTINYQIHLEGSQPNSNQAIEQGVNQATAKTLRNLAPGLTPTPRPGVIYLHGGPGLDTLDYFGAAFIGLVVFFLVFVITSVSFLRERTQGTLERLLASPLRRDEIVLGYMGGFTLVALLQGLVVLLFSLYVLRVHNSGSPALVFLIEALVTIGAVNLGIFLSMFARTEFQAVQFIPLVIVPQMLLSGIIFPINTEPAALQYVSNVLPLSYAVYGLRDVMLGGATLASGPLLFDIAVLAVFCVAAIAAATLTLKRSL